MNPLSSGAQPAAPAPQTAAQQRAATHAATSGFDWEKTQSYFNLVDSLFVTIAHLLGVVHETVDAHGAVTPRNITLVAHDVNAAASNFTGHSVGTETSAKVAQIAAAVAAHGDQIANVASHVQSLASQMSAHTNTVTKVLEAVSAVPMLIDDVAQLKSAVAGTAGAGGSHQADPADEIHDGQART